MKNKPFTIHYRDGYAYLTVYPVPDAASPLYPEEIEGKLRLLGIPGVRRQTIISIMEEKSGKPVNIAPWIEGKALSPVISVETDQDNMSAYITVSPGKQGGEPLSVKMILEKLKEKGIIDGIREEEIRKAVEEKLYNTRITAAAGIFPVHPKSASAEYFFETDRGKPFKELDYGRIDLRELNFIQNTDKGKLLARILDPVPSAEGKDIFGNILYPRESTDTFRLNAGNGTYFSEDGKEILAAISGNVKLKNNTITVEPVIKVENVDYSNGNMNFEGAIDIKGRIADGFEVRATGDIQIGKSVSRVRISTEGDLILKAGISGNDEGTIFCKGDLYARYIENASVVCRGSIFVEEAVIHSNVKAEGDIILSGKRAEIFGGSVVAGGNIRCKKLGSINEPVTKLHLGVGIDDYSAILNLKQAIDTISRELDSTEIRIAQFNRALEEREADKEVLEKIKRAVDQLEAKSGKLRENYKETLKKLHETEHRLSISDQVRLTAEQKIFGKVFVYFGSVKWQQTGKGTPGTVLSYKNGKIIDRSSH